MLLEALVLSLGIAVTRRQMESDTIPWCRITPGRQICDYVAATPNEPSLYASILADLL